MRKILGRITCMYFIKVSHLPKNMQPFACACVMPKSRKHVFVMQSQKVPVEVMSSLKPKSKKLESMKIIEQAWEFTEFK